VAKIYRVNLNKIESVQENVHMITELLTKCIKNFKRYHSDKHLSEVYLQDGGNNKLAWIWNKITSTSRYVPVLHPIVAGIEDTPEPVYTHCG